MPDFRFYLEHGNTRTREVCLDVPDHSVIELVAKQVARQLAAHELGSGQLRMAQDITVFDMNGDEVARYPLSSFLRIEAISAAPENS